MCSACHQNQRGESKLSYKPNIPTHFPLSFSSSLPIHSEEFGGRRGGGRGGFGGGGFGAGRGGGGFGGGGMGGGGGTFLFFFYMTFFLLFCNFLLCPHINVWTLLHESGSLIVLPSFLPSSLSQLMVPPVTLRQVDTRVPASTARVRAWEEPGGMGAMLALGLVG